MFRSWDDRRNRKARLLLRPAIRAEMAGVWADIGCGDGIFTRLLLEWLGSMIVAVDQDRGALQRLVRQLPRNARDRVQTLRADFTQPLTLLQPMQLDGLLLANSLHFVHNKLPALTHLVQLLKPGGTAVIIEYNASRGNWAVPHPFSDERCLALMTAAGLHEAHVVTREPSSFLGEIYTAVAAKDMPENK